MVQNTTHHNFCGAYYSFAAYGVGDVLVICSGSWGSLSCEEFPMTSAELRVKYGVEPSALSRDEMRKVLVESCEFWLEYVRLGLELDATTKKILMDDMVGYHELLTESKT